MGKETGFKDFLENGDVILIMHPTTLAYETRTVKAVLSDVSLLIEEPFSTDLISYQSYQYIRNPHARKERKLEKVHKDKAATKLKSLESRTFRYRVKKANSTVGTWEEVVERRKEEMSSSELLDLRSKYAHDRHC